MVRMEGSDAAEVARARAGDHDAFQALVERHSRAVFRLAYRMTGNEHDAEDVVQESFLKVYRRLDQFEERAHFGSWLYRIVANCAFDLLRGRPRQGVERSLDGDSGEGPGLTLPSSEPSPDRLVFSAEVKGRVQRALFRLSPMEKSAFVLRHYQGLSVEEIGGVLGTDTNATKSCIFRAVRKMREALQPVVSA